MKKNFIIRTTKHIRIGIEPLMCIGEYMFHIPFLTAGILFNRDMSLKFYRLINKIERALSFKIGKVRFDCLLAVWYIGLETYGYEGIVLCLPFYLIQGD